MASGHLVRILGTSVQENPMTRQSQNKFPPGPKGRIPLLHQGKFASNLPNTMLELAKRYGDIVHFRLAGRHVYLFNHPDFIYEVLVKQQHSFTKERFVQQTRLLLGESLLTNEGQLHLQQRLILQPIFHQQVHNQFDRVIVSLASDMSQSWRENAAGQPIDLINEMSDLTMDIIAEFLFNESVSQQNAQLQRDFKTLLDYVENFISPALLLRKTPSFRLFSHWQTRQAKVRLNEFMDENIAERKNGVIKSDVLSNLIQGDRVTGQQLRDLLITLFIAGHGTSVSTLARTFSLLSQYPVVAMALKKELDSVLGGRSAQADDINPLEYTRMVFTESLRLYPPAWIIGRETTEEVEIGGYAIPANTTVLLSQWVTHHDPRYYPHPFRFRPERWTPESRGQRPKMAFFPFGAGLRQCIGEHLVRMTGVLTIATIMQDWYFQPVPGRSMQPQFILALQPRNGGVTIPIAYKK